MNIWDTITGNDLNREWRAFAQRAEALPVEYRTAWAQVVAHLFQYSDFTGRNLTPIADAALGLLEDTAVEGLTIREVLGDDIPAFCAALAGVEGARTYRDRWRDQLNRTVARKLGRGGD